MPWAAHIRARRTARWRTSSTVKLRLTLSDSDYRRHARRSLHLPLGPVVAVEDEGFVQVGVGVDEPGVTQDCQQRQSRGRLGPSTRGSTEVMRPASMPMSRVPEMPANWRHFL